MGWTFYHVDNTRNIDKKAEIDKLFTQEEHDGYAKLKVLKSSVKGNVYYGAIEESRGGNVECVFGVVTLIAIDNSNYCNFGYKEMSEDMGPGYDDCPIGILKLLTPTEHEYAKAWRERCYASHEKKKNAWIKKIPIGSQILWTRPNSDEQIVLTKMPPLYQFKTWWWYDKAGNCYVRKSMVNEDNSKPIENVAIA